MTGSDIKETFGRLHLKTLPREWIDAAWKSDFTPPPELPAEYELQLDHDLRDILRNARDALRSWAESSDDEMSSEYSRSRVSDSEEEDNNSNASFASKGRSWRGLGAFIHRRASVALLSAVIAQGNEEDSSDEDRDRTTAGARLYLTMVGISGAHVFGVFNSCVFEQAVSLLNSVTLLGVVPTRGKGRKKIVDEDAHVPLHPAVRRALTVRLSGLLDDLGTTLVALPLRNHQTSTTAVASVLMVAARVPSFATRATELLERLCTPFHGDAARDVVRLALPAIVADTTLVHLLGKLAKEHSTCNRIEALVQQILLTTPDKADARARAAATAVDLSAQLPDSSRTDFVLWLTALCHADAVKHRLVGIDAVLHLLSLTNYGSTNVNESPSSHTMNSPLLSDSSEIINDNHSDKDQNSDASANSPLKHKSLIMDESMETDSSPSSSPSKQRRSKSSTDTSGKESRSRSFSNDTCSSVSSWFRPALTSAVGHRILFGALLSRCQDNSPRVRAKALGSFTSLILSRHQHIKNLVRQVFLGSGPRKEFFDFQQFLNKKKRNTFGDLDPLPSVEAVLDLLKAGADDDKVFVRKNSLHALANVMHLDEQFVTPQLVNLLKESCRDLSVCIRKMLMQCLTDILLLYPTHELLPSAWVGGVIPLLSDNDGRVHERALEVTEQVILDNLVPENKSKTPVLKLPWKLISLITTMDLRKVFKYACQCWSSQRKISKNVFTAIQSYIGGEHTLAAWYFLENLSEFHEMPKSDFLIDYFYDNILESNRVEEVCAKLVLRCILLNWTSITPERRDLLATQLRNKLDHVSIPMSLISPSLDIVWKNDADSAKPWAISHIQIVENDIKKIMESFGEEEAPKYDDPALSRLIFLLGDLSHVAPDIVSGSTVDILANFIDISNWEKERLEKDTGRVHAVIIVTLGKLSLQNHITAKVVVPLLGALVAAPAAPGIIKINACIALADLCVRFSSLVEPYFGDMCVCLRDPDPCVRKNTLNLISYLVLEDFLKLKVPVFIYLMSMMKDSVTDIKDTASSFIVNSILHKNPHVMSQHFIPVIMFLNDYKATEGVSPQEKETFCLCGEENASERKELYSFMLNFMRGDMKIRAKYKLSIEVLEPIAEGNMALDETGTSILKDALHVMGCEEIRFSGRGRGGAPEDEDEDMETVQAAKNVVYNELFDNLTRQILTETIVPAFIKLKRKLMSLKSPLVQDLMICLRDNLKDYKDEVEDILASYPDVAAEVVHDLRELDKKGINSSPDGPSSQPPDQDTLMIEMTRVAKRISINVMEHGTSIITGQAGDHPNETPRTVRSSARSSASPRRPSTSSSHETRDSLRRPSDSTRRPSQTKRRNNRKSSQRLEDDSDSDSSIPRGRRQRGATPAGSSPPTSVSSLSSFSSSASRKS